METIQPDKYFSQNVLIEEASKVFGTHWLYACLTIDVENFRDYVLVTILNRSVIIFNNGKTIKAFQNVCPHRFNRIFLQEAGNGPLVCKYHSWGFDGDGNLIGKDKKDVFPDPKEIDVCLKEYKLKIVGKFIFIHLSETPQQSLEDQLGELTQELLEISDVLGEKIYEQFIPHKANWKFIVENVIETQHCRAIHQDTFIRTGYCVKPPEFQKIRNNSVHIIFPIDDENRKKRDKLFKKYLPRKIDNNYFKHTIFFPNFSLAISEGLIITIGQILPQSPGMTNYKLRYFYSKIQSESPVATEMLGNMKDSVVAFNNQVFDEDKEMLERSQEGVVEYDKPYGFVYNHEHRIKWFTEAYLETMNHQYNKKKL